MRDLSRIGNWWLILIIWLLFFPFLIQAQQPLDIVINEIAWMGKSEGWQYEWIELYNNTSQTIDLSGWKIENASSKGKVLEISEGKILARDYFLICKKEFEKCDLKNWLLSLNNNYKENGKLILKDKNGNLIDQTPEILRSEWPAGDNSTKQTMERKDVQITGNNPDNWATSQNPGGTPKTKNSVAITLPKEEPESLPEKESIVEETQPDSVIYPSGIIINEILPSPSGPDETEEWIEIFNQNSFEVDLSDWKISDTQGISKDYTFPKGTIIKARGFLVIHRPITKITLNNSGDGLNLLQPDGKIVDSVNYGKALQGKSYNRTESGWAWSNVLTPGSFNIIPALVSEEVKPPKEVGKTTLEKELEEKTESEKELATIGKQIPKEAPFFLFLTALAIAIFSGIIILILKNKLKKVYDKNV